MPLSARLSLAAQKTIREAFEDLNRVISADDRASVDNATLEDVRQAAYQIEEQLAARQSLRNMRRLSDVFMGMDFYSRSIETLCMGTPYLPWIWSPMKVILKIASDYVEAFERIIKAYVRIAEPLARFKIFNQAHANNPDVQQTLAIFYADILKFHKEAYQFVRRNGWQLFFLTSWRRFERRFDSIFDDLQHHEQLVDKTVAAVDIFEARKMRENLESWRKEALDKLAKDEEELTRSQCLATVGWLKLDESDQLKIFESIASEALDHPGTCDWILKQPKIQAWMRCSQDSTFLFFHGPPGSGKSVLATQIATFLKASGQSLVITHFCTYSYATSKDYEQILRSILVQLIQSDSDLVAYVHDKISKKSPTVQVLEQLLRDLVSAASLTPSKTRYVHIILDGLDECDGDIHMKAISQLQRIVTAALQSGSTVCKVLLCTHRSQAIAKKARHRDNISLSDEKENIRKAIQYYASRKLAALKPRFLQMGITDEDLEKMELRIAKKADGMFLWARLVLEYLANNMFYGRDEIIGVAEALPQKLKEFYGQILSQLTSHFDERSITRMKSILGWIAFAKRPLRMAEFRSALAFSAGDPDVTELAPPYLFDMCAPIVEKRRDSTFAFIHVSVKDYLQSSDSNMILDEATAFSEHGLATAACLLSSIRIFSPSHPVDSRHCHVLRGLQGFQTYSMRYWVEYLIAMATPTSPLFTHTKFLQLSCEIATALSEWAGSLQDKKDVLDETPFDDSLIRLRQHEELYRVARAILLERQRKFLSASPQDEETATDLIRITNLESLRSNYQLTIKKLLQARSFSGTSLQELERFKQEFRASAFTCRLWSCPHAVLGFENEDLRLAHETSHHEFVCDVVGCQYPPFTSARRLKEHKTKCHGVAAPLRRTTIRKHSETTRGSERGGRIVSGSPSDLGLGGVFNTDVPVDFDVFPRLLGWDQFASEQQLKHVLDTSPPSPQWSPPQSPRINFPQPKSPELEPLRSPQLDFPLSKSPELEPPLSPVMEFGIWPPRSPSMQLSPGAVYLDDSGMARVEG